MTGCPFLWFAAALLVVIPHQGQNYLACTTWKRMFTIPVRLPEQDREKVLEYRLFVSRDVGRTWQLEARTDVKRPEFFVAVPEPGLYWFALQTVWQSGKSSLLTPEVL
jgi:hypothetical protein